MVYVAWAGLSKSQLEGALNAVRGENKTVDSRSSDQQFEALTKYGTDLTAKAAHLDPIIGRDEEVCCLCTDAVVVLLLLTKLVPLQRACV